MFCAPCPVITIAPPGVQLVDEASLGIRWARANDIDALLKRFNVGVAGGEDEPSDDVSNVVDAGSKSGEVGDGLIDRVH
jgi:hypothetical protein